MTAEDFPGSRDKIAVPPQHLKIALDQVKVIELPGHRVLERGLVGGVQAADLPVLPYVVLGAEDDVDERVLVVDPLALLPQARVRAGVAHDEQRVAGGYGTYGPDGVREVPAEPVSHDNVQDPWRFVPGRVCVRGCRLPPISAPRRCCARGGGRSSTRAPAPAWPPGAVGAGRAAARRGSGARPPSASGQRRCRRWCHPPARNRAQRSSASWP